MRTLFLVALLAGCSSTSGPADPPTPDPDSDVPDDTDVDSDTDVDTDVADPAWLGADVADGAGSIGCSNALAGTQLAVGGRILAFGYDQAGANDQHPVVALYDAADENAQVWCVRHETEGPDGRAVAATWDGGPEALVAYTIDGGGSALDSAADGWLGSYGPGGGGKVTVLARVDMADGAIVHATFVHAKLTNGNSNSLSPTSPPSVLPDGRVELRANSAYHPMNPDRSRMECEGPSGFAFRAQFSADLSEALCTDVALQPDQSCATVLEPC